MSVKKISRVNLGHESWAGLRREQVAVNSVYPLDKMYDQITFFLQYSSVIRTTSLGSVAKKNFVSFAIIQLTDFDSSFNSNSILLGAIRYF